MTHSFWLGSLGESLFEVLEELKLLELLILYHDSISIVGVVGLPLNECGVVVSDLSEAELACNASYLVSRLSRDDLVTEGVPHIADLIDAELPLSTVEIVDAHH